MKLSRNLRIEKQIFLILCCNYATTLFCIKYRPTQLITTCLTKTNNKALQFFSQQKLLKLHTQEQKKIISLVQEDYHNSQPCKQHELINAYLLLQKRMNLPKVIPLFIAKKLKPAQTIAQYRYDLGCIVASCAQLKNSIPSQTLQTFLHELRHGQQHLAGLNMNTQNKILKKKIEQDAERYAAHSMRCIICLMFNQHCAFNKKHAQGYFCTSDYNPYLRRAVKDNSFCTTHNQIPKVQLCICDPEMDLIHGKLLDRIPKKISHMPFFSKPPKC